MCIEGAPGRRNQTRVVAQAKVIVGAHVDHFTAGGDRYLGALRAGNDAFLFVQPLLFQFADRRVQAYKSLNCHLPYTSRSLSRKIIIKLTKSNRGSQYKLFSS